MENSFSSLNGISSITFASLSLIAMPFVTISVEAVEEKSRVGTAPPAYSANIVSAEIEMINEDANYIYTIREHSQLD